MAARAKLGRRAPAERRSAVLDAAESLFVGQGVDATTIDAIAARAGVAKGTVYLYFPAKEHIIRELETRFDDRILGRVDRAAAASTPAAAVEDWCAAFVDAYLDELAVHDMLFYGRGAASREAVADNALIDDLAALLRARGHEHPDEIAALLVGGITTLVDRAVLRDGGSQRPHLIDTARRFAASTLAGTGES